MAIKVIFFDAAGTLIKPARPVGESYAVFARKYGIEVSEAEIAERFRRSFQSAPLLAFPGAPAARIEDLERAWWRELVRYIFEPWQGFQGFDDYFAELFAYFAQPEAWLLYPEVAETLSALERRRLGLSVISNFDSRLIGILEGLGAARWFEHVIVSSRVGFAKPQPGIFNAALERHGLAAEEALHVGDSEEKDFYGATQAGLKAILVDRSKKTDPGLYPRVVSLKEVLSFLHD